MGPNMNIIPPVNVIGYESLKNQVIDLIAERGEDYRGLLLQSQMEMGAR